MENHHSSDAVPAPAQTAVLASLISLCHAGNLVRRHLERTVLHNSGLTWTAFDILHLSVTDRPIDTRTIAEVAGISKATVSINANTLIGRGLLSRGFDPDDNRRVQLHPTAAAMQLINELRTELGAEAQRLLSGSNSDLRSAALTLLQHVASPADAMPLHHQPPPK